MKIATSFILNTFLVAAIFMGCNKKNPAKSEPSTMTDIDGNTYQIVKIGNQRWMAENLKVTHYRDGTPINNVTDKTEWNNMSTGAYCAYNNSEDSAGTYGYLYNWHAFANNRNIAPSGWHVPTDEDWKTLEMYLGMSQSEADKDGPRGIDEGGKLKETGTTHWETPNTGATNESGFTALPSGYRGSSGNFGLVGVRTYFWASAEGNSSDAWRRILGYTSSGVQRISGNGYELYGFSVRLVKDN